jgi:hypothetical protein
MVRKIKIYRDNKDMLVSIDEVLKQYESKLVSDWNRILEDLVYMAFDIKDEDTYKAFLKNSGLQCFDYEKLQSLYEKIKTELDFFDDDILKYISYIATFDYFEQIGNPSWDVWLNAININKPFDKNDEYGGFSIMEVMYLKYGENAIRRKLLSALRVLYGSFA